MTQKGDVSICYSIKIQMRHSWLRLRSQFDYQPQYRQDVMLHPFLWNSLHENYDQVIEVGKRLTLLLSKGKYDEQIMNRAFHLYESLKGAWYGVQAYGDSLESKGLQTTTDERARCERYSAAAFRVFYECLTLYLDAQVCIGHLTPAKRERRLKNVRRKYMYNKY